ncbi:hypothetical protein D3P09_02280 [Paenibacillus pinisoli]|uniref:Uncharacterized protein n=1 Tax=Paenibacillus pinisoli TaxID=1276110 RepID=A0A3A6PGC6_9BACL|nr:hypothetical protein [Paenibacillus pinisoli]RJX40872.1 hypothetical protein D3P09_02280 [Paenibacillus pinisoli]
MKRKEQEEEQHSVSVVPRFTRDQFLQSRQRTGREKDVLAVVLESGKTYTIAEANAAIRLFLTKEAD